MLAKEREWDLGVMGFGSIQIDTGAPIHILQGPLLFNHCSSSQGKRPGESVTTTFIEFYDVSISIIIHSSLISLGSQPSSCLSNHRSTFYQDELSVLVLEFHVKKSSNRFYFCLPSFIQHSYFDSHLCCCMYH